ncbi:histidine kinase N-terminal 7TM domain-containing protein, partial [Halobium palmae]
MVLGALTWPALAILAGVSLGAAVNFRIAAVSARKDVPVARVYRWLVLATAMLCVASAAKYLAPSLPVAFAAYVSYHVFNLGGAALFVLFVIVYTGHRDWLTRRRTALFALEPATYVLLLATNPIHGLVLTDLRVVPFEGLTTLHAGTTPLTALHILYTGALTTAGYVLLARFYVGTRNVYRKQTGVILLGSLLIPVGAFLYSGGVTPIDLTPFALVVNGVVVWIALFRYDFLDVTPLAADLLIERMEDAVVVTDREGSVLDVNDAATRLFSGGGDPTGRALSTVAPMLDAALEEEQPFTHTADGGDDVRTFDPNVTFVEDQFGIRRGRLIVLRDVTEQVRRRAELERQNERLDEFVSVVSHDIRNPLSVAEGYVDLARVEDDTAHLDRAADAIDRMNALVDDLLTLC